MLKMVLADDEAIVRRGLRRAVNWEELGIEIVAEAVDGQQALDLCLSLRPDILFTDIRMPMLDGLEVAMKLKEADSGIHVVVISGAQDFNYAKTALDIDVEGYVLKPVNVEGLKEVFKRVTNRIRLESNRQTEMELLRQQIREHIPLIRDNFLRGLVSGAYSDLGEISEKAAYCGLPLRPQESPLAAVLQIDEYAATTAGLTEEARQILLLNASRIIAEVLENADAGISFQDGDNEFVLIFNQATQNGKRYARICEEISLCLERLLCLTVSIGMGRPSANLGSIHVSFKEARSALQYKFYTGRGSILDIGDIKSISEADDSWLDATNLYDDENTLINRMRLGDSRGVSAALDAIFHQLCSERNMPIDYVQSMCMEMVTVAIRNINDIGESPELVIGNRSAIQDQITRKECAHELITYVSGIFQDATAFFSRKYNQKNSKIIQKIKGIIESGYKEDLSVARLAEEVYLTPNYISLIFRQETGETITQCITRVRMEHAKELLKTTDLKIAEIAEQVGYEDSHYFSKAFKKYTGIFPQKYRL